MPGGDRRRRKGRVSFTVEEAVEFLNHLYAEKPVLPFLIPLFFIFWCVERWVFSLSNWVPLVLAVWATVQYYIHQRQILVEDLNRKWKRVVLSTSPITPVEHCEWLNKLLLEVWLNYIHPKLSTRFSSMVEKRLKQRKSKLIERVELQEFSLGSFPPCFGLQGTHWSTSGDQRFMRIGFDWDTSDISIMLLAKLAKPMGTARIVINSLHIKGDLLLMPVVDGRAILYSFISAPEVRIGVAFGSGGSQSLPATELPGVSSWLVKILTDTLVKTMVEPRRRCYSLPAVDLRKKAVGGVIHVTVISARKLCTSPFRGSPSRKQQNCSVNCSSEEHFDDKDLQTFVEVELEQLTRRTNVRPGSSPRWDSTFNMVLHEETGILRFHLYNCTPNNVKFDYLASCEIKLKYVADDSTMFWAVGHNSGVIAELAEICGKEVEMAVPFEGVNSGELIVKLVLKEWQFSDGSHSFNKFPVSSRKSMTGLSNLVSRTGRKINVVVVEGKDLSAKEKSGKCDPYVKLQYGKAIQRTRTATASNAIWNQKFEFDEIEGGECLMIKCYSEEMFGDDGMGSARVSLEGLVEGSIRDVWVPLEKVSSGELRLQIEAVRVDDYEGSKGSIAGSKNGWIELVLIEAKDLIAADLRGTSDPYVRVQYGNLKKRTKVMYKTLNPQWNQTLEFPDDGSPLMLHVKDHNALLPTSSIGDCVVEYQGLPPNQMSDKWIPLQGVKRGEIHVKVTRKIPEIQKRPSLDSEASLTKSHQFSSQMKQMMIKFHSLIEDGDLEGLSTALSEMEGIEEMQEEYMVQLEMEQTLLLEKIKELGQEIFSSSTSFSRMSSGL
ncbi:extended synaptotagmin-1 [Ricinus communis]|uniref:Synaptotagmin, putative n=1 Tax=Ricinus communis TaxID=3988 RepID=B9T1N6_RICCO|nr:extended synaptotagmin-1 [Ricinus communis]EEF30229.1 synaptotagmin, putative [Ricinus communis]|eukprot:XP_002532155.1 extended synaptotagmin-1 [Ricinus communis]